MSLRSTDDLPEPRLSRGQTVSVGNVDFIFKPQDNGTLHLEIRESPDGATHAPMSFPMRMTKAQASTLGDVFKVFAR